MESYLELLEHVLSKGKKKEDRTGTGTLTVFGYQWRHNMADGFPLLTTKFVHWKSVLHELLWYLRGDTNIIYLTDNKVTIWNEWAKEDGSVGPIYGKQWVAWEAPSKEGLIFIDQIKQLVKDLKTNHTSRRMVVSAWNVAQLGEMALPPCHAFWQCQVLEGKLNLHLFMRSLDIFLGLPFDIGIYATMIELLCKITGWIPGELLISVTDVHLYSNHIKQAKLQIDRHPRELPKLVIDTPLLPDDYRAYRFADFNLLGYNPHPKIPAPIAV